MKNYDLSVLPKNEELKSDVEILLEELRKREQLYKEWNPGNYTDTYSDWLEEKAKELGIL